MLKNFSRYLKNTDSLKAKAVSGGIWLSAGSGFEQALRLIRNMILTRFLAPEVFGVVAIVLSVNAAFESFSQIGIKEAVIQSPRGEEKTYLNGAWLIAVGRAIALYAIIYVCSPLLADFYNNDGLISLFRVAFLSLLFTGLMSSGAYVSLKKLKFKRWAIIFHGGGWVGILTSLVLTYYMRNEWALVIGFTVESFSRLILSYIYCPFWPTLNYDREDLKALFNYAKGMFGLPLLTFIFMKCDVIVIGKVCDFSDLGLYSMVSIIAWSPFQFITLITAQVIMPVFSEKQEDKKWANKWILNITKITVFIGLPLLFFVGFYGEDLLTIIYGVKYGEIALPFVIIFFTAFLRTSSVPIAAFFLASGHPEFHRLFVAVRALLIMVIIYPAVTSYGLIGAASAGLFSMVVSYFFQMWKICKVTGLPIRQYLIIFIKGFFFSVPIILVSVLSNSIYSVGPFLNIIPGLIGCVVSYGIIIKIYLKPLLSNLNLSSK